MVLTLDFVKTLCVPTKAIASNTHRYDLPQHNFDCVLNAKSGHNANDGLRDNSQLGTQGTCGTRVIGILICPQGSCVGLGLLKIIFFRILYFTKFKPKMIDSNLKS